VSDLKITIRETCPQCIMNRRQMTERESFQYLIGKQQLLGCRDCSYVREARYCFGRWKPMNHAERYKTESKR